MVVNHSSNYRGMRWFKCDLQMQTPGDAQHWQGRKLDGTNDREIAEKYAKACYEEGLEVIGITDHNFLGNEQFLPLLRTELDKLEDVYGWRVTLFPGFEFEAYVGRGIHVLCLFETDTDLRNVDRILSECGVPIDRIDAQGTLAKSDKNLKQIIEIVQQAREDGRWRGIVIIPHAFHDSIFDDDRLKDWIQAREYLNSDLLALEVNKPISKMSAGWQKLLRAGEDCDPNYKRQRPIATIMSSDNKMLNEKGADGKPKPNSIGYRYTWIKMSEPSIEALRQAFLDHDSRIILPDDVVTDVHPEKREKHARIVSVSINNAAFLQSQEIPLSPNLNCIIGGRGTGKSTILEGVRIALGKDNHHQIDGQTKEKIQRIQELLSRQAGTEVRIRWRTPAGVEDVIVYSIDNDGKGTLTVEGREITDMSTFLSGLPIQIFSQQQLNEITRRTGNMLLSLLDDFIRDELQQLRQEEESLRGEIRRLFSVKRQLEQVESDIRRLQQEISELERQIEKLEALQDAFSRYQKLQAAGEYIDDVRAAIDDGSDPLRQIVISAERAVDSHEAPSAVSEEWPEGDWFDQRDGELLDAKKQFVDEIKSLVQRFRDQVERAYFQHDQWDAIRKLIKNADGAFQKACEDQGVSPEDIERLQALGEQLRAKRSELDKQQDRQTTLREDIDALPTQFDAIHENWLCVYQARKSIADEVEGLSERYIDLQIEYSADEDNFLTAWSKIGTSLDKRQRIGRNWEEIGKCIHRVFLDVFEANTDDEDDVSNIVSPWELLQKYILDEIDLHTDLQSTLEKLGIKFHEIKKFLDGDARDAWETARVTRVADTVDLVLYRAAGATSEVAGRISDGSLSDGQRNTAALLMILAKGETPLIFDQPEDELDSNFIFRELVPMLRSMKTKRQIILVTHNANLPVNADAELVYALETKDGSGVPLAQGGLDQADVTQAVLEIMEGSEIAFKRRREKYHF